MVAKLFYSRLKPDEIDGEFQEPIKTWEPL